MPRRPTQTVATLLSAAVVAALVGSLAGGGASAEGRASSRPARSRPASVPSGAAARLAAQAQAAATKMLSRLDGSFLAVVRPPFVVIGNLPRAKLRKVADGSVVAPARAMWKSYFDKRPADVITALLFRDDKTYRAWAKKLFGDTDLPHFGYCRTADRVMVMNISTGTGTLVHELTHALIHYDFPDVPTWFNEGLASLHEQCYIRADGIVGCLNWRLPALQDALRKKKLRSLRELVTAGDFYTNQSGLNYAQARYFVMYMQQRRLLKTFYKTFRRRRKERGAAVKCIEAVFGAKLEAVERQFIEWVKPLRWR